MKIKFTLIVMTLMLLNASIIFSQRLYVLCYHSFLSKTNVATDFSISELKSHIKILKDGGMKFVGIDDFLSGNIYGNNNVLITIDDGNRSVYDAYKEVFKPENIKIALALYNGSLGKSKYLLSYEQIDEIMKDKNVSIMGHGYFSEILNDKLYQTNETIFRREIFSPKKFFEERYTIKVDAFAHPFGLYSDSSLKLIKEAGYKIAFTIKPGRVEIPYTSNTNVHLINRYMVTRQLYKGQLNSIIADSKK